MKAVAQGVIRRWNSPRFVSRVISYVREETRRHIRATHKFVREESSFTPIRPSEVDGDSQGLERVFGALSAHMWPGMILKSGNRITTLSLIEKRITDEELNYEFEYEVLSHASDEKWEFVGESRNLEGLNEAKAIHENNILFMDSGLSRTGGESQTEHHLVREERPRGELLICNCGCSEHYVAYSGLGVDGGRILHKTFLRVIIFKVADDFF